MSYSRNFGFRSFENIVRDARFKTPTLGADGAGAAFYIGEAIVVDPANPGQVKRAGAGEAVTPGAGVAVFEHITVQGVDPQLTSPQDPPFDRVPNGSSVQLVHGNGTKVWLKNTPTKNLYDGRPQVGRTVVAGLGATPTVAVGDFLTPDGSGGWREATGTEGKWLYVEQVTSNAVECRFTF